MKNIYIKALTPFLLLFILAGCDDERETPINETLKVSAGNNQEVTINTPVALSGTAPGVAQPFTLEWTFLSKPQGSIAAIENHTQAIAQFIPDLAGSYVIQLKVSKSGSSATDIVTITAAEAPPAFHVIAQPINEDRVLEDIYEDPVKPDYVVTGDVQVNATLTIKPGVTIQFEANKGLVINPQGALIAKGTSDNRIYFIGKEQLRGYWKGILINSNNPLNELEHVVVSFAGGQSFPEASGIKANVLLTGDGHSGAAVKISTTSFRDSDGYGLYLKGRAQLNAFVHNYFANNRTSAAYIPAGELHKVDFHSHFTDNNTYNGIETGGELNASTSVTWTAFNDGSKYLVTSDLKIRSGLNIMPGATFEFKGNVMMEIEGHGYLNAVGTDVNPITFTAHVKTVNAYWKGILFRSTHDHNKLIRAAISFAGSEPFPGISARTNVAIAATGNALIRNSTIHDGIGYGVIASYAYQVNPDVVVNNSFYGLPLGMVLPQALTQPERPALTGDWVDWWSFTHEHFAVDTQLYNKTTNTWYGGAAGPWHMNPQGGFGLRIEENGNYTWTIAERHTFDTQCVSYSTEFITGTVRVTDEAITFHENFWRSKFVNNCDHGQNTDITVTPGQMTLRYQINRMYNMFTGQAYWELTIINPDNSSFSYYRM